MAHSLDDVEKFFKDTVDNRFFPTSPNTDELSNLSISLMIQFRFSDYSICYVLREEGIILKDLESKWEPGDRSGKWLKLKPDYIHAGADLDVIIIG